MKKEIQHITIPKIGYGTADLKGDVSFLVCEAIEAGYRLIDTASVYGTEKDVGVGIEKALKSSNIKRNQLFIETKLNPATHGYYETLKNAEQSLNNLKLDYLDMYLIHWPVARGSEFTYKEENIETWQAFETLYKQGKVKGIGVCNFLERHLLQIIDSCSILPVVNQLELHPGFQQVGLVQFCRERGLIIEAWSPMGRGILMQNCFIQMAEKYGVNIGQLALKWSIQKGFVPLSRSSTIGHIHDNLQVFDFSISDDDMNIIDSINTSDGHMDIWSYKRQQMY